MHHQSTTASADYRKTPAGRRPLRVLLVEDSAPVAERIAGQIAAIEGVELIATVASERAAVEKLTTGGVDAVVLDLTLQQGSGFGVLRSRQQLALPVAVVVYTSYDIPAYRQAAAVFGASEFLNKARDHHKLAEALGRLASGTDAGVPRIS